LLVVERSTHRNASLHNKSIFVWCLKATDVKSFLKPILYFSIQKLILNMDDLGVLSII
jgi:hypothetical protein